METASIIIRLFVRQSSHFNFLANFAYLLLLLLFLPRQRLASHTPSSVRSCWIPSRCNRLRSCLTVRPSVLRASPRPAAITTDSSLALHPDSGSFALCGALPPKVYWINSGAGIVAVLSMAWPVLAWPGLASSSSRLTEMCHATLDKCARGSDLNFRKLFQICDRERRAPSGRNSIIKLERTDGRNGGQFRRVFFQRILGNVSCIIWGQY